jgi:hypothetical protein
MLSVYVPAAINGSGTDDNANQNGLFTANPGVNGVSTATATFTLGTQPSTTAGNEPGYDKDSDTAEDANVNLTLDFGLVPKALGVGNLVFKDVNANSTYQEGTDLPIGGVTLRLFSAGADPATATPISTTVSLSDGSYFLEAALPGTYFVHIPASNFLQGGPLQGLGAAALGSSSDTNFDDNGDQNALPAANPTSTGLCTSTFSLARNTMPINGTGTGQAENGFNKTSDDWADRWANLTIDLGFASGVSTQDRGDFNGFAVAAHAADGSIRIGGAAMDAEDSTSANATATGDDVSGVDDEDLTMPSFVLGNASSITVPVTIAHPVTTARVNVFVDWNGDGDVDDLAETQTVQSTAVMGQNNLTFNLTPPAGTVAGTKYLRIRAAEGTVHPGFSGISTLRGEVEDYAITVTATPTSDFGDFNGFGQASSLVSSALRMGVTAPDTEITGVTNTTAQGDDTGGIDDEDGVTHGTLRANQAGTITVTVTNTSGAAASLSVWADWNRNNNADTGEQIASSTSIAAGTIDSARVLNVTPPASTATGTVPLRARLTAASSAPFTGAFSTGEVEDHFITISAPNLDFGDYSSFAAAAQGGAATIRIGTALTDVEASSPASATAAGDDTAGTDDEDLTMPVFTVGKATTLPVPVTLASPVTTARVNVYVDWNGDGDVADLDETRVVQATTVTGLSTLNFSLTPPIGTVSGTKYLRIRAIEGTVHPGFSGTSMLAGEVEDYAITVNADSTSDFGDFSGFAQASSVASTTLRLGPANADAEPSLTPNTLANADDTSGTDDEDGVTHSALRANQAGTITVNVTNTSGATSYLNVWADWNRNNAADAGEQIATNIAIATGTNDSNQVLDVTPPATTAAGTLPLRARLTVATGATLSGAFSTGEVEDHLITISAPNLDFGDYSTFAAAAQVADAAIRIGTIATDVEVSGPANASATGDDGSSTDDEDLTMPLFAVGSATTLNIPVTITAGSLSASASRINVFVDWNGDGDASDLDETQTVQSVSVSGTRSFSLTPPAGTTVGTKYLRIRFTEGTAAPAFSGISGLKGEVEDYAINVQAAGTPLSRRVTNTLSAPAVTFTAWQSANGLNGENTATGNSDGDAYSNLAEYALGLKPDSGVLARAPFSLKVNAQTGGIDAVLHRPATSRDDIAFTLEGATGGPASTLWSALSLVPTATVLSDGTQALTYTSVQGATAFAGASTGFVRVKISLDADQNGSPEATTYTPVFAWSLITLEVGQQTFSMPLLTDEVFSGSVLAATGTTLTLATGTDNLRSRFTAGTAYYAEITSGSLAGHRLEINETASTANTVALETETALTAGVTLSIRPHWTLSSVFTPALFNGSDSAETADRLLLFEEGAFVPVWLNGSTWTRDSEGVNSHILSPGQGLLIQPRTQAITLPVTGQVRTTAFVLPLKAENQLIGTGYATAKSPVQRGLNTPAFTASAEPTTADRLRLWIGDTTPGASGYVSYYLKQTASGTQWTPESGEAPTSQNEAPLFQPFRATFLKTTQDHPAHVESPR